MHDGKLRKYLLQIWHSSGNLECEVVEYGLDAQDARKRAAEKLHKHISNVRLVGEIA